MSKKACVISIFNSKGGSSKTTTCMSIAGEVARRGKKVMVVDSDPQQSATIWSGKSPDSSPFPAAVMNFAPYGEKLHREIEKQLGNYDYILVDNPGSLEARGAHSGLLVSDLCIIPFTPAPTDLWELQPVKLVIERAQSVNPTLRVAILPTRGGRTALAKAILGQLSIYGIPILFTQLANRVAYQEAAITGKTVSDLGKSASKAADEVKALVDEVLAILGEPA
jgi:chromosome partitioning protein